MQKLFELLRPSDELEMSLLISGNTLCSEIFFV